MNSTCLPEKFKARMERELGGEYESFIASYALPAARGVRANTLKISSEKFRQPAPFEVTPVPWIADGFYIPVEKPANFPQPPPRLSRDHVPSAR